MKNKNLNSQDNIPIKTKNVIRILVAVLIVTAFVAGYYHSLFTLERKKYNKLEDSYVRVRMMIGREEMQKLIDDSYDL